MSTLSRCEIWGGEGGRLHPLLVGVYHSVTVSAIPFLFLLIFEITGDWCRCESCRQLGCGQAGQVEREWTRTRMLMS